MTIGGDSMPVHVVTDSEIDSGLFTVEPGPAIVVSSFDADSRGITGGNALPVYPVDTDYVNRNGIREGFQGIPVVDMTNIRSVGDLHRAVPVYVTYGTLGVQEPEVPEAPGNWWEVDGHICSSAFQPLGADSFSESIVNKVDGGNPLFVLTAPDFDSSIGWNWNTRYQGLRSGDNLGKPITYVERLTPKESNNRYITTYPGGRAPYQLSVRGLNLEFKIGTTTKAIGWDKAMVIDQNCVIVYQWDGLNYKFYIDGESAGSGTFTGSVVTYQDIVLRGINYTYISQTQAVAWYYSTLTQEEVASLSAIMMTLN